MPNHLKKVKHLPEDFMTKEMKDLVHAFAVRYSRQGKEVKMNWTTARQFIFREVAKECFKASGGEGYKAAKVLGCHSSFFYREFLTPMGKDVYQKMNNSKAKK